MLSGMIAYLNGSYLYKEEVCISPDDRGFLFADGIYEVIRSYDGELFKARAHLERLAYGARELRLERTDFSFLLEAAYALIQENDLTEGDALVYIQVTRGAAPRAHRFPPEGTPLTIYASARAFKPHEDEMERGIRVIQVPDQRWARCDIKSTALLPNILAHQEAVEAGASEALLVRDGAFTEGTHSNVIAVSGGRAVTPPLSSGILAGVTRSVVLELCGRAGVAVSEEALPVEEAARADELMIVGTTVEVTPVTRILNGSFRASEPGPVTRLLQAAFREHVRG